ncbi:MAG: glycosyltransferase [Bacteroidetes bacterium]|nr:glycosyltransferase [Bacteroidota bacterium]
MIAFLQILCWLCLLGILHTYLIYPLIMWGLGGRKNPALEPADTQKYQLSILMAVYNEELVLAEKLENLSKLQFPTENLRIYVGSDASSDQTIPILESYKDKLPGLRILAFAERRGKPSVLNDLAMAAFAERPAAPNHIFIITDANVFLDQKLPETILRKYSDPEIGLVDTRMLNTGTESEDISKSEAAYISLEGRLKLWESNAWKMMMGPFGGCYSLRSDYFQPVPPHFLVDDFYIAMRVFEAGGRVVSDPEALCYEAVSHDIREEIRRKARISAGNFQNLARFKNLLFRPLSRLSFAFVSHKVLRWITPLLFLGIWISSGILGLTGNFWYLLLFLCQTAAFILVPLIDRLFAAFGLHLLPLRHIHYFIRMNGALLKGLGRYLKGIKKGAWEPTKRTKTI